MSAYKPLVFISHATRRENCNERTKKIRIKISELLRNKGWNVFVDEERLKPSDKWRPIILNSLSNASAGIVLFDKTAVEDSYWVQAEALIMCFRQALHSDFQLIPVFLEDFKLDDEHFNIYRPFQINEVVFIDDCNKSADQISEAIVCPLDIDKAKKSLSISDGNIWIKKFELLIKSLIKAEELDVDILYDEWHLLAELDDVSNSLYDNTELIRAILQLIHQLEFSKIIATYKRIKDQSIINGNKLLLLNDLIKVKWIENEWVKIFSRSIQKDREKSFLVCLTPDITANLLDHIKCFFSRLQYENDLDITAFTVGTNAGEGYTGEDDEVVLRYIEEEIKASLKSPHPVEGSNHTNYINKYCRDEICVCYISKSLARHTVLAELKIRYPDMMFLIELVSKKQKSQFGTFKMDFLKPFLTIEKIDEFSKMSTKLITGFNNPGEFKYE